MERYLVVIDHDGPHDRLVAQLRALEPSGMQSKPGRIK